MSDHDLPTKGTCADTLNHSINLQAVFQDTLAKQTATIQAICDHFGDKVPTLYHCLQTSEGLSELAKVIQDRDIAALELNLLETRHQQNNQNGD